jgi:exosortase B
MNAKTLFRNVNAQSLIRLNFKALPIFIGLAVMYVPTFYSLITEVWGSEVQGHAPIIFVLAMWLLYKQRSAFEIENTDGMVSKTLGWLILSFALVLYILGRSQQILMFEVGSFVLVLFSLICILNGFVVIKQVWFPIFFMLFMIPLPGPLVSVLTLPMKIAVSYVAEQILFLLNYPVGRNGVILQIGQYQLLVADACAGLQTFLTLEALGLFYLNIVRHASAFRNVTLALLVVPISFTANVIRIMTLTLITFYFGDEAGQGFLHGFAGMVLFLSALTLLISIDTFVQRLPKVKRIAKREV